MTPEDPPVNPNQMYFDYFDSQHPRGLIEPNRKYQLLSDELQKQFPTLDIGQTSTIVWSYIATLRDANYRRRHSPTNKHGIPTTENRGGKIAPKIVNESFSIEADGRHDTSGADES